MEAPEAADEDQLSLQWDRLSAPERVRALRRQFQDAIGSIERGEDIADAKARADASLSALRGEVYATARGREEHGRLERQI